MEKLYELRSGGDFDVVVVDTPPTRHALDFIDAPRRLTRFLDHRLYRVLTAPTRGVMKAVNAAAQTFIRGVSKVVGADVFDDAIAFFQAFEGMEEGFKERADARARAAQRPEHRVRARRLAQARHRRGGPLLRRQAGRDATSPVRALDREPHAPAVRPTSARGAAASGPTPSRAPTLGELYANLADFALVAAREEEHLEGLAEQVAPAPVVRVPFLRSDVHDLAGLDEVGTHLFAELTPVKPRCPRWRAGSGRGRPGRAAAGSRPWARAAWRRWRRPPGPARGSPACGSRPSPSGRGPATRSTWSPGSGVVDQLEPRADVPVEGVLAVVPEVRVEVRHRGGRGQHRRGEAVRAQ